MWRAGTTSSAPSYFLPWNSVFVHPSRFLRFENALEQPVVDTFAPVYSSALPPAYSALTAFDKRAMANE